MKQDTNINIKLSTDLKADVKKYLGDNVSEELRTALEVLVSKKKNNNSPYQYCFICDKTKQSFDEMNLTPKIEWDDDNVFTPIVCDECLDRIIKTSKQDIINKLKEKKTDKLIRILSVKLTLYSNNSDEQDINIISTIKKLKQITKLVLWLQQQLVELYPTLYRIESGRIIMSNKFDNIEDKCKELLGIYDNMTK